MNKALVGAVLIALVIGLGGGYGLGYFVYQPQLQSIQDNIDNLTGDMNAVEGDITSLQSQMGSWISEIAELNSTLHNLQSQQSSLNQSMLEKIAVLEDEIKRLRGITILYDRFDAGLDNWSYWGDSGYILQWVSNTANISGDGYVVDCGMQKVVDLSGWSENGMLLLSFDWRATSDTTSGGATGAGLWIQDADSNSTLHWQILIEGGTTDTRWQNYFNDISSYVLGHQRIRIILYLHDGWIADWRQTNAYDNIKLTSTEP